MTETQNLISQRKICIEHLDFELWNCFRSGIWSLEFISQAFSNNQDTKCLHSMMGAGSN